MRRDEQARATLARRSPAVIAFIGHQFERQLRSHFTAVRVSRAGKPPDLPRCPVVIYSNHPSWWDAVVYVHLGRTIYSDRTGYGPMDGIQLQRYPLLDRLGIFGIDLDSFQGSARFLSLARALFSVDGAMLWILAEGSFTDPASRPVTLRPGISHLATMGSDVVFVPLAIDYRFWNQKRPEILLRFGAGIACTQGSGHRLDLHARLETALTQVMDVLQAEAATRDPGRFETLVEGGWSINPVYDLMRRCRAWWRREAYYDRHVT